MKVIVKIGYESFYLEADKYDIGVLFDITSRMKPAGGYPMKISDKTVSVTIENFIEEEDNGTTT